MKKFVAWDQRRMPKPLGWMVLMMMTIVVIFALSFPFLNYKNGVRIPDCAICGNSAEVCSTAPNPWTSGEWRRWTPEQWERHHALTNCPTSNAVAFAIAGYIAITLLGLLAWVLIGFVPGYRLNRRWRQLIGMDRKSKPTEPVWCWTEWDINNALRILAAPLRNITPGTFSPIRDQFHAANRLAGYVLGKERPGLGYFLKEK